MTVAERRLFEIRWTRGLADLMTPLTKIYGGHPRFADFVFHLETLLQSRCVSFWPLQLQLL